MARSIAILRAAVALIIDHHTVHHAPDTVSVHVIQQDTTGAQIGGADLDQLTLEELGVTSIDSVNSSILISAVQKLTGISNVSLQEPPPPPPKEEPAAAEASAPAANGGAAPASTT